jgi:hypothetical protein
MWTGGESGLKQDSGSGIFSGQTEKAGNVDVESTQLDSIAFDSQRDPQLSDDPIEFFSYDTGVQPSDPISDFTDAAAYQSGPELDSGYDPSVCIAVQDDDSHIHGDISDTLLDSAMSASSLNHDATQSRWEQSLVPQQPKFMWEESGFLSTVRKRERCR